MSQQITVLVGGSPVKVHAAPGITAKVVDAAALALAVPKIGVFKWTPAGDGTYKPTVIIQEQMIRAVVLAQLVGMDQMTIYRLIRAGFVKWDRPAPNCIRVSIESWLTHQEAVSADPEFWERDKNKARFSAAL